MVNLTIKNIPKGSKKDIMKAVKSVVEIYLTKQEHKGVKQKVKDQLAKFEKDNE